MTADPITPAVLSAALRRATFTGPTRADQPCPWKKVVVRPVELRGARHLQFAYFDGKKTHTANHPPTAAEPAVAELVNLRFAGVHIDTDAESIDVRTTKKGEQHVGRRAVSAAPVDVSHNRVKDVPLPEGRADRLLEVMGIATADGRVKPTMRAKFTQINEFLKHLSHTLDESGLKGLGRPVRILDAGCGASYLTLAAHHYLNRVLGLPAELVGVDVNDEVIRKSVERTGRLGDGPAFVCGPIAAAGPADVVIALHACDTATDDALAVAVRAGARLILCAPCCHRHLNRQLADGPIEMRPVLRHGILRERTADILTDTFRALALRMHGYRAEVVEFVGLEHTARNLLLRATLGGSAGEAAAEFAALKRVWGVEPYIERALQSEASRGPSGPG